MNSKVFIFIYLVFCLITMAIHRLGFVKIAIVISALLWIPIILLSKKRAELENVLPGFINYDRTRYFILIWLLFYFGIFFGGFSAKLQMFSMFSILIISALTFISIKFKDKF